MVTVAEIDAVHERLGAADTLVPFLQALAELGVEGYSTFVDDGHSEYLTADGVVIGPPAHDGVEVARRADADGFHTVMARVEQGGMGYVEMCAALAATGVSTWTFDTAALTMSYRDTAGNDLLVEHLGNAQ